MTIGQVAALAAVSTATASRALNHPGTVSDQLRDRVDAAVMELAYIRNQTARALSSLHSGLVGILVAAFDLGDADLLEAIHAGLAANGYATLIAATGGDSGRALGAASAMAAREIEGMVAIGTEAGPPARALLDERRIPYVLVDAGSGTPTQASVNVSYTAGGENVGRYLLGLGHRSLAFLGPADGVTRAAALLRGVRAALATSRDTLPERVVAGPALEIRPVLRQWLTSAAPPTAVVCADDLLALAALQEGALLGIAVPRRLSVVGCGDLPFARHTLPTLTTLRFPGTEVGTAAVRQLIAQLDGGEPMGESIPIKLVIRQSSGPAPL